MRALRVFLLTLGYAALLHGEPLLASPSAEQQRTPSRGSREVGAEQRHVVRPQDGGHSKQKSTPQKQSRVAAVKMSSAYGTARPGRSMKLSGTRSQTVNGGAMSPVLPNAGRTAGAKSSPNANITSSNRTSPVRMGGRSLPTLPSSNPLIHRGPYTAVLGGGANTRTATAGAITGTSMNRKP